MMGGALAPVPRSFILSFVSTIITLIINIILRPYPTVRVDPQATTVQFDASYPLIHVCTSPPPLE